MRSLALLITCALLLACACIALNAAGRNAPDTRWLTERPISVNIQNQPLDKAMDQLFRAAGVKYRIACPLPKATASLGCSGMPFGDALGRFLYPYGLGYTVDRDTAVIIALPPGSAPMTSGTSTSIGGNLQTSNGRSGGGGDGTCSTGTSTSISTSCGGSGGGGAMGGFSGAPGMTMGFAPNPDDPQWLSDKKVTTNIQNMSVADAVDKLLRDAGVRYRVAAQLPTDVTVSLSYCNVPLAGALRSLLASHGFTFHAEGNTLVIDLAAPRVGNPNSPLAGKFVTMSIDKVSITEAIDRLLSDAGVAYRIVPALSDAVTMSLSYANTPLADALSSLLTQQGLTYYMDGNTLVIDTAGSR